MVLHILDTSNYIWAGAFSKKYIARGVRESNNEYCANEAPIGGVRFLLSQVAKLSRDDNNIIMPVFDRTPEIKRSMYQEAYGDPYGYKGNRPTKPIDINHQKDYAEEILRDLGYPVQAVDGYEADDVIYSIVKYYKDDFEHIYIHTRDSDLSFLVSENVSIDLVGDKGKVINMYNYNSVVESNNDVLYNTIHLRKLCAGDTSDNIPGIGWDWAKKLDEVIPNDKYKCLGDLDIARDYIKKAVFANPTTPGAQNVLRTFNIICPLLIPADYIDDSEMEIDRSKLSYYLHDWNAGEDKWDLEERLMNYINLYYE